MEYVEIFDQISFGTVIAIALALLFLGGLIFKGLEKYHTMRKHEEKRTENLKKHDTEIIRINKDMSEIKEKVEHIADTLNIVVEEDDKREARRLRREILKFSDGLRSGKTYSRDAFQDIMESNEEYENIILRRNITNGFTEHEMAFIEKKYDELYGG